MTVSNAGNADNEYGLLLTNVGGTVTLDDMTFNNAADNLVYLTSTSSSTFNVTGSVFSYPAVISGTANSAMLLEPSGAANLTASITGSTFTNIVSASTQIGANTLNASGTLSLTFSNNTINSATGRAGGVVVSGQELTTTSLTHHEQHVHRRWRQRSDQHRHQRHVNGDRDDQQQHDRQSARHRHLQRCR